MANPFQKRVAQWCRTAFGTADAENKRMRSLRFLEEAVELVQAAELTKAEAQRVLDYVYDRPVGQLDQEVGGVMITLATLVDAHKLSMYHCGEDELVRCWQKIDKIRVSHGNKPRFDGTDRDSNGDLWEKFYCACGQQLFTAAQIKSGHCDECVRIRS